MDPYRKVNPGERLKVPARAWNALMGGLKERPGFEASGGIPYQSQIRFPVRMQNATPMPYSVVGLADLHPSFRFNPLTYPYENQPPHQDGKGLPEWAVGLFHQLTTPANAVSWCICEKVVAANDVGICVLRGVTFARIRVRDSSHRFAVPSINRDGQEWTASLDGILDSTECQCEGAAQIINWSVSGNRNPPNVHWAMVLL